MNTASNILRQKVERSLIKTSPNKFTSENSFCLHFSFIWAPVCEKKFQCFFLSTCSSRRKVVLGSAYLRLTFIFDLNKKFIFINTRINWSVCHLSSYFVLIRNFFHHFYFSLLRWSGWIFSFGEFTKFWIPWQNFFEQIFVIYVICILEWCSIRQQTFHLLHNGMYVCLRQMLNLLIKNIISLYNYI